MAGLNEKKGEFQLLLALACGGTVEQAARQCNLTERTIYRRLKNPAFRSQIADMRKDMMRRAAGAMAAASMESVKTLLELQKQNYPPPVRLGAARSILEIGLKMREVTDIEDQLAEVRAALGVAQNHGEMLRVGPSSNGHDHSGLLRGPPDRSGEDEEPGGTGDGAGESTPNGE